MMMMLMMMMMMMMMNNLTTSMVFNYVFMLTIWRRSESVQMKTAEPFVDQQYKGTAIQSISQQSKTKMSVELWGLDQNLKKKTSLHQCCHFIFFYSIHFTNKSKSQKVY